MEEIKPKGVLGDPDEDMGEGTIPRQGDYYKYSGRDQSARQIYTLTQEPKQSPNPINQNTPFNLTKGVFLFIFFPSDLLNQMEDQVIGCQTPG